MNHETNYLILLTLGVLWSYGSPFFKNKKLKKVDQEKLLLESIGELEKKIGILKKAIKIFYFVVPFLGILAWDKYLSDQSVFMFIFFIVFGLSMSNAYREIELMKAILTLKKQSDSNKTVGDNSYPLRG